MLKRNIFSEFQNPSTDFSADEHIIFICPILIIKSLSYGDMKPDTATEFFHPLVSESEWLFTREPQWALARLLVYLPAESGQTKSPDSDRLQACSW